MCCERFWTAVQVLWSTLYVISGAAQLMAGIFFTISLPELHLYSLLLAGTWNIITGIGGGMVACIGLLSPRRQEMLLYMAVSILIVNLVNVVLTEFWFYKADMPKILRKYPNQILVEYACFVTRIAAAVVLVVAFLDTQLSYCSMQMVPKPRDKKLRGSHEQVSDIEYIIPRPKNSKPHTHTVYNAYAQSWVFDAENNASCSGNGAAAAAEAPYFKILQNGTPKKPDSKLSKSKGGLQNGVVKDSAHLIDNPVVHVEEASDDSTSNSDRKLCYMKSFSRSQSPVLISAGSSQVSLNINPNPANPQIYECLEKLTDPKIYRTRLNTALSSREEDEPHYQAPQTVIVRRTDSISPKVETVQYASLMKELQQAIVGKKEPKSSATSPESDSDKTQSSRSDGKSSDADFSKELEAALQLIQDLESPNTVETPSEAHAKPLAVWRNSDASDGSEKTLSAVGSLAEIASPLAECQPELYTFKAPNGKIARVAVRYPDSQSTSGYSSPTHGPTPDWSTTSSVSGSHADIKPTAYTIQNTNSSTVISLYSPTSNAKGRSVTLVNISGNSGYIAATGTLKRSDNEKGDAVKSDAVKIGTIESVNNSVTSNVSQATYGKSAVSMQQSIGWKINSLLRKKKPMAPPRLCPELEGAIIKSESLAYLTDIELLARHQRNKDLQREIEKRVVQQLGVPRTESKC